MSDKNNNKNNNRNNENNNNNKNNQKNNNRQFIKNKVLCIILHRTYFYIQS